MGDDCEAGNVEAALGDEHSDEYLESEPLNPIPATVTDSGRRIPSNEVGRFIKTVAFVSSVVNIILIYHLVKTPQNLCVESDCARLNEISLDQIGSDSATASLKNATPFTSLTNSTPFTSLTSATAVTPSSSSQSATPSTSVSELTSIGSTSTPSFTSVQNATSEASSTSVNDSKFAPSKPPFFALCLVGQQKVPWDSMKDSIYNRIFKSIENVHVFAACDSPTKDIVSMQDLFKESLIDAMPMTFTLNFWRGEIGIPKSGWPDYAGVCPDGYHSSAYSATQYMHWEQCFRMIKRQERLQGWQYDLIIKWRVDRQPSEAFPHAADPRWGEISDTDYYSQGINQASTPLNIPFDQWFVIRRKSAHVIMSEFVDTMFECQSIEELKSLISVRDWNAYLWNESKLAYHIHKAGMHLKWGVFPARMA